MGSHSKMGRRRFLQNSSALLGTGSLLNAMPVVSHASSSVVPPAGPDLHMSSKIDPASAVWIHIRPDAGFQETLAARELARGIRNLGLAQEPKIAMLPESSPREGDTIFTLAVGEKGFKHPEAYEVRLQTAQAPQVHLSGASPQALLYAVFDFLERQGAFFGLDGEVYPLDAAQALTLPPENAPWHARPRFQVRGLIPWPDFLNCITVFNREDLRAYLEAMVRMRFNTLGVHVYSSKDQWAESFLSFEYAGAGHLAYTDTTATNRWGYIPERTSRYGMGAANFYAAEVFGSEATTRARNCWEAEEFAQQLWGEAFRYAKDLGIRTGVGFEPYQIPDEIFRATPPEAHYASPDPKRPGPRIDPESIAARDILEARLGRLLEAYPSVDYVWLWEDESMSWASQKEDVPLSVTPFRQAHDFLKRHAPGKRLVISGWGGVVRHFAYFHRSLPEDVVFSSLNDNLGWDPVSEEFAKLGERERWPIPWLEDDPAMWLPQFHVHRFVEDMDRAERFGCQGLLGIHWRHRIMDANASFLSRYSWDKSIQPAGYYQAFARVQAREPTSTKLATILIETDRDRRILCSFTGEIKDGHHQIHEYSGDYDEAFQFWNGYVPPESVKKSQAAVAERLRQLTQAAQSPMEAERLNYLTQHMEFLAPYSESWSLAFDLNRQLQKALELRRKGKADEARSLIMKEGVPLWLMLAPQVRKALLHFQQIVSTRNDLGTLASMHNKYERLALHRLRASMKEFLEELPPETEKLFAEVRRPDSSAPPRIFIPTRPTLLRRGEQVRFFAVAPSQEKTAKRVTLFTREAGSQKWNPTAMKLSGRSTFEAELVAPQSLDVFLDYYVELESDQTGSAGPITAPLEAPSKFYTITIV